MPDVYEIGVIYRIPILPVNGAAFADICVPWPRIKNIQPPAWLGSYNKDVLALPSKAGSGMARDTALQGTVGIDLCLGFSPVGGFVDDGIEAIVGEFLIPICLP